MNLPEKYKNRQKGQTLIFVILVMTIALAVGISISTRTVSTIRRTTNVDTSSRAVAAAEAGLEYYLSKSPNELSSLISDPSNGCVAVGKVTYPPAGSISDGTVQDDVSSTTAQVEIKRYGCLSSNGQSYTYPTTVQDGVLELKLSGTNPARFNISWTYSGAPSSIYIMEIYETGSGNYEVIKKGYNVQSGGYSNNFQNLTNPSIDYTTQVRPRLIRILSLYNSSAFTVRRLSGNFEFPFQGFELSATGIVGSGNNQVRRKVLIKRSLPYLPPIFNFAIYSHTGNISK